MKKKIFLLILPFFCVALNLKAQKFGYIDTEYITSKMPEYQTAQAEIEKLTTKWIKEVSDKNDEVKTCTKTEKKYTLFVGGEVYSRHDSSEDLYAFLKANKQINLI